MPSRIAKADVNRVLEAAAARLLEAGGRDGRVSRAEVAKALGQLTGTEQKLVDVFFRFVDHRDFKAGAQVTKADLDRAVAYAKEKLVAKYDLNNNGLSRAEIEKMSLTGRLAVQLAKELKAAAQTPTSPALENGTSFLEFREALTTPVSKTAVTEAGQVDALLKKQLIAACHQSSYEDVKTLADAFGAVDEGEFIVREVKDRATGERYTVIDYGAGDSTYGAVFKKGEATPLAAIHDGEISRFSQEG